MILAIYFLGMLIGIGLTSCFFLGGIMIFNKKQKFIEKIIRRTESNEKAIIIDPSEEQIKRQDYLEKHKDKNIPLSEIL